MKSIRVKFAFVDTTIQLSSNYYRLFRFEYATAIILCVYLIAHVIYLNSSGQGFDMIFSTAFTIQMIIMAFVTLLKKQDLNEDSVVYVSYLPVIYFFLMILLGLLVFYNLYFVNGTS